MVIQERFFDYTIRIDIDNSKHIVLVRGDSGSGKTIIYKCLYDRNCLSDNSNRIICFNYKDLAIQKQEGILITDRLKRIKESIVVIDNADIILGFEERRVINSNISNQYILFGRNDNWLVLDNDCIAVVKTDDSQKLISLGFGE